MKQILYIFLILATFQLSFGQSKKDPINAKAIGLDTLANPMDSLSLKKDSIQNSLKSKQAVVIGKKDSIENKVNQGIGKANAVLQAPSNTTNQTVDHVNGKIDGTVGKVDEKLNAGTQKINNTIGKGTDAVQGKIDGVSNTIEGKIPDELKGNISTSLDLPTDGLGADNIGLGEQLDVPALDGVDNLSVGNIDQLEIDGFDGLNNVEVDGLENVQQEITKTSGIIESVNTEEYAEYVEAIQAGDVQGIEDKALEHAKSMDQVQYLESQTEYFDQMESQFNDLNELGSSLSDPEMAKKKILEEASKQAINHFAGQDQVLKTAQNSLLKYKQKYSSVESIKDLPKKYNPLQGKPTGERLLPGFGLEISNKNDITGVEIMPQLAYRLTHNLDLGAGASYRFMFDYQMNVNSEAAIYGGRAFLYYNFIKGLKAYGEGRYLNAYSEGGQGIEKEREWYLHYGVGIARDFNVYKSFQGQILALYNFNFDGFKIPTAQRLNLRVVFFFRKGN